MATNEGDSAPKAGAGCKDACMRGINQFTSPVAPHY